MMNIVASRLRHCAILALVLGLAGPAAAQNAPAPVFDSGHIAWVLMATVLVLMMAFPGIALFYSGLSRSKNSTNAFMQTLAAVALGSLVFLFFGFGPAFVAGTPFVGEFILPSQWIDRSMPLDHAYAAIPVALLAIFQMAFAAVTVSILLGAWVERVRFPFVLAFVPLWILFVYVPVAHWVWSERGWLRELGVLDFAGGTVVHICSGFSALALALVLGKRRGFGRESFEPNSSALVALGAAFLIVGWYGFNAGSALAADASAIRALINTHVAACAGVAAWVIIEIAMRGYTTLIGVLTGALGALVAITPASGYVAPEAAVLIGAAGAGAAFVGAVVLRRRGWFDDSLDVFGVHGLAGIAGSVLTGPFAVVGVTDKTGFLPQIIGVAAVGVYSLVVSLVLAYALRFVVRARVTADEERVGLDAVYHGEAA